MKVPIALLLVGLASSFIATPASAGQFDFDCLLGAPATSRCGGVFGEPMLIHYPDRATAPCLPNACRAPVCGRARIASKPAVVPAISIDHGSERSNSGSR